MSDLGRDRILGDLRSLDGVGVVRLTCRVDVAVDDLWSALTDPGRISGWYGHLEGDLQVGGEFRLNVDSSGWVGTGRVEVCETFSRLLVTTRESDATWQQDRGVEPFEVVIEATLTADDEQAVLVIDVRGVPLEMVAFYGAGWQIHAEALAAYLDGRQPDSDVRARFDDLVPHYQDLAALVR
jgi:uncharacterized protein YndB with AHSA1/START domain